MPRRPKTHRPAGQPARAPDARPSAARRGYGRKWREGARRAYLEQSPLCEDCLPRGIVRAALHVDHVLSRRKGGSDEPANLRSLCQRCHARKTAREDGSFGRPAS